MDNNTLKMIELASISPPHSSNEAADCIPSLRVSRGFSTVALADLRAMGLFYHFSRNLYMNI